jgi:hypothetical protein
MIEVIKPHFFYTDKVLLLTVPKISHSRCRQLFLEKKNQHNGFDTSFPISTKTFEFLGHDGNEYEMELRNIWKGFLDKNEKRDLIFLYRNPLEHFISGFIKDWVKNIEGNYGKAAPFVTNFINGLPGNTIDKKEFSRIFSKEGIEKKTFEKYYYFSKEIIKFLFDYHISNNEYSNSLHFTPWLTFLSSLYDSDKFDHKKIAFLDIYDGPIEYHLQKYVEIDYIPENFRENEFLFYTVKEIIKENGKYKKQIDFILYSEFLFYNKLKNITV